VHKLWSKWNELSKKLLWIVVIIGLIASIPLTISKLDREASSKTVEFVVDYKDLLEIAGQQHNFDEFIDEQLSLFKEAGITSFAIYEGSLKEFEIANYLTFYSEKEMATIQGRAAPSQTNSTYVVFASDYHAEMLTENIKQGFAARNIEVRDWIFNEHKGLIIEEPSNAAASKILDFDPVTINKLLEHGMTIVPRFSDYLQPYNEQLAKEQLAKFKEIGVRRIIFEGDAVKGAQDPNNKGHLAHFSQELNRQNIGIGTIENLKKPQAGMAKMAYLLDYDVARLISLSAEDSLRLNPEILADRFVLAAKDRNIRIVFLNLGYKINNNESVLENSIENVIKSVAGENGAIPRLEKAGFKVGSAESFEYKLPDYAKILRIVVVIAAIAMIALLISAFLPSFTLAAFIIGLAGSAALYVLSNNMLELALALGVAISGPTLGAIWIMNRIYARTFGSRRVVGANNWSVGGHVSAYEGTYEAVSKSWIFPDQPKLRRLGLAFNWFFVGTCITLTSIPFVYSLLYHMKYTLVIDQFRGVSLLMFAPLGLVLIYVLLYQGYGTQGVFKRLVEILKKPITIIWVLAVAVLGIIGMYYFSRSGNAGQVSDFELALRRWLETSIGVRPRFKEFLLGHPIMILGLFLALRYRAAWFLVVVGTMGQLSMVSTFTHLHSPLTISALRTVLGLGVGIVIGLVLIAIWIVLEGVCRKWMPKIIKQLES